jgi:hypothetical protein
MRNQYHRTVSELTHEELAELKRDYYTEHLNEVEEREPSLDELQNIDDIIDDAYIMDVYSHLTFVDEDFFCNCENKC